MSQINPHPLTASVHSTQLTTGPVLPPQEIPGSQVYWLPTQATSNAPIPFYAVRSGAMIGIFSDWDSITWMVKAVAIADFLKPCWRKCFSWNQAVHYINTRDYLAVEILAGPPADPPAVCLQPEQVMANIFLPGTILLAQCHDHKWHDIIN